jgi:hypothetical protein
MSQIFISYRRANRDLSEKLAAGLESAGHEVWWDADLIPGDSFREVTDQQLNAADVVIVIWTPDSVNSKWVIAEADHGNRQGKLLPLRTEDVLDWQIPKPYGQFQTGLISVAMGIAGSVISGAYLVAVQRYSGGARR